MAERPCFRLSLGITGHRSNRLPPAARALVEASLRRVLALSAREAARLQRRQHGFFSGRPSLTLVTALAEGADTMAAKAALAKGYALVAVLPFAAEEYAKDFSGDDAKVFSRLCAKAKAVEVLGGSRADEETAYEIAGWAVLDRSDILLVVWDGKPSAGRGGTVEIMSEAERRGLPVILIDAEGKEPARARWPQTTNDDLAENITRMVRSLARSGP